MIVQLLFIFVIVATGFFLFLVKPKKAFYLYLAVSLLLHKELFSIYSWNILPIRLLSVSLLFYVLYYSVNAFRKHDFMFFKRVFLNPLGCALSIFWFLAGISLVFSRNLSSSFSMLAFLTTIVSLYIFVIGVLENNKSDLLRYLIFYGFSAFILSLIGFIQVLVFQKFNFIFGAFWNIPGHFPRIGSLFWDVNHFAGFLVLLLPFMFMLIPFSSWKNRFFFFCASASMLIVLILTNARSGWIAAFISFAVFILFRVYKRFKYKGIYAAFFFTLITSGLLLGMYMDKQSAFRQSIRQYFHYRLDSFDSHFLLLEGAWQVFEKYPILGGGYGNFFEQFSKTDVSAEYFSRDPAALNTRVPAHSIWGELLSETGVLGLSAMLVFYGGTSFLLAYVALRSGNRKESYICTAMLGSVIGILTAGIFYSYNTEFFWIVLFLFLSYAISVLPDKTGWLTIFSHFLSNSKTHIVILALLSVFLVFLNLGENSLIPWDEAIYAQVARNASERGEFSTLYWKNADPWFEKPPLYFFVSGMMLKIIPDTPELAVRLPSAVFGVSTVLVCYFFAKKLFGKTAGLIAGISLITTFHFLYYSRIGMLDVTCTFFILFSVFMYYLGLFQKTYKKKIPFFILSGVACGLGVLTKGVVGLIPLVVVFIYSIFYLLYDFKYVVKTLTGFMVFLIFLVIVTLPWHYYMYLTFGNQFIDSYIGYHVLGRAVTEVENKNAPFFWYVTVLKVSMRLWFVALIPSLLFSLWSLVRGKVDRLNLALPLLASVFIFMLFSFSKSKLVWYIIPIYPFLSIIIGYFYSHVLNFIDLRLSKLRGISSFTIKSTAIYVTLCISLLYLLSNRELVYTSDLTGPKSQVLMAKDRIIGVKKTVLVDSIEYPLVRFYTRGEFEEVNFTSLSSRISQSASIGEHLVFITKESRFTKLKEKYPSIRLTFSSKEWYLGEL